MPTRPAARRPCAPSRWRRVVLLAAIALACDLAELDEEGDGPDEVGGTTLDADELADGIEAGTASARPEDHVGRAASPRHARAEVTSSHDAACRSYCRDYDAQCGDAGVFADDSACTDACAAWSTGETHGGAVSCRAAFLAPGQTSCIAAGPASPVCADAVPDDTAIEAA